MLSSHSNHFTDAQCRTGMIQSILLTWKLPGYSSYSWGRIEQQFCLYRLILSVYFMTWYIKKKKFEHYSRRTLPEDRSCLHRQSNTFVGQPSATEISFAGNILELQPEPQSSCRFQENQTNKYFKLGNGNLYKWESAPLEIKTISYIKSLSFRTYAIKIIIASVLFHSLDYSAEPSYFKS